MSGDRVTLKFYSKDIPLMSKAVEMAEIGIIPDGSYSNKEYLKSKVEILTNSLDDMLLFDAQTSGGLLIAVSRSEAEKLKERLIDEGYERSCIVGEVLPKKNSPLVVE